MRILLDTHIALWGIVGDKRLASGARDLIGDMRNEVFVSAASVWEISFKHGLSRGSPNDMPVSGEDALGFFQQSGYQLLAIRQIMRLLPARCLIYTGIRLTGSSWLRRLPSRCVSSLVIVSLATIAIQFWYSDNAFMKL